MCCGDCSSTAKVQKSSEEGPVKSDFGRLAFTRDRQDGDREAANGPRGRYAMRPASTCPAIAQISQATASAMRHLEAEGGMDQGRERRWRAGPATIP